MTSAAKVALHADNLHPRYRRYLERERDVMRSHEESINQRLVDETAERYVLYLRCGRSVEMPSVSRAKELGLKIVKMRRGPRLVLPLPTTYWAIPPFGNGF